jgi:hypothetical protein
MTTPEPSFQELAARQRRGGVVRELTRFLMHNKKWWLVPILLATLLLALAAYLSSSAAAPFIYTLF